MKQLPKFFEPHKVEKTRYEYWLENDFFKPSGDNNKEPYSIVIPPPNVTGSLHMGHALNVTLQDILSRWKRMTNHKVLWVPGTDHAGIATQNVVEKDIAKEKIDRHSLGRDKFIQRVWKWKEEYGGRITNQLRRLGVSCDWTMERFTLDEGLSLAVKEVFVRLFKEGLIYRSSRLINWCPRCHTALSDLEVEHEEAEGSLTYIKYPVVGEDGHIVVATTRPETLLGDTAVAVNPVDERYAAMIGKEVSLPLTDRTIPIIADSEVDSEFGTGAVKVTPSHDFNDEAIAKRQSPHLAFITVIGDDGVMTDRAGENYAGLDRYECRKKVLADLREGESIVKLEAHQHSLGHCYRCNTIIEPLPTIQWYVRMKDMAVEAVEAVKTGRIRIMPDAWYNSYYSWMKNIKDWCISRQIWWGHRIPVWYCTHCKGEDGVSQGAKIHIKLSAPHNGLQEGTYNELRDGGIDHDNIVNNSKQTRVDIDTTPICEKVDVKECPRCGGSDLIRDPDVLDTWFSSSLWPFSTLGWPESTEKLKTFYPTSVLITAFDILFFWVARMIMMGLKVMNEVPFRDVYIHAIVRDSKGQKMSKSKGNVVDPLIMIDKYGTDAFRFTLAVFAVQGRDIRFSEERIEGYRHFINKLWNAARFIQMFMEAEAVTNSTGNGALNPPDKWILSRLNSVSVDVNAALADYRFNDAANSIYQFVWHELCDWYIELSKTSLKRDETDDKQLSRNPKAAIETLLKVLDYSLRLLHPFMPFITEEIWCAMPYEGDSISRKEYPYFPESEQKEGEKDMQYIIDAVSGIRNIRGELNISPSKVLKASIKTFSLEATRTIADNKDYIMNLARLESLEIGETIKKTGASATSVKSEMEIYVPLSGLLNVGSEIERLEKELSKIADSIKILDRKLFNEDFLNRAPKKVIDKEKFKYEELTVKKERIMNNIIKMRELDEESRSN